jgi:hypothetical protein
MSMPLNIGCNWNQKHILCETDMFQGQGLFDQVQGLPS